MNIKFEKLSAIGKVWSIRELLDKGIFEKDGKSVEAAVHKLDHFLSELENSNSNETYKQDGEIIRHSAYVIAFEYFKRPYQDDEEVIVEINGILSKIWAYRGMLDELKYGLKTNFNAENEELPSIIDIENAINKIYYTELKEKALSGKDRQDLFKIKEEVEDVKIKYNRTHGV